MRRTETGDLLLDHLKHLPVESDFPGCHDDGEEKQGLTMVVGSDVEDLRRADVENVAGSRGDSERSVHGEPSARPDHIFKHILVVKDDTILGRSGSSGS